jgi:hypothetical protein
VKIKWNLRAFDEIRRSPKVEAELRRRAQRIATACGPGYVAVSGKGRTRARAAVITADQRAVRDNASNNTLIRNLDRGRD